MVTIGIVGINHLSCNAASGNAFGLGSEQIISPIQAADGGVGVINAGQREPIWLSRS